MLSYQGLCQLLNEKNSNFPDLFSIKNEREISMKICVVCKEEIPVGQVRLMYKTNNGEILHFHEKCGKKFDRRKYE